MKKKGSTNRQDWVNGKEAGCQGLNTGELRLGRILGHQSLKYIIVVIWRQCAMKIAGGKPLPRTPFHRPNSKHKGIRTVFMLQVIKNRRQQSHSNFRRATDIQHLQRLFYQRSPYAHIHCRDFSEQADNPQNPQWIFLNSFNAR
jgi:hypothetical protein